MKGKINNVTIMGIASAVPVNRVSNEEFVEQFADRRIKKQIKLTGIKNRRVCVNGQTATDLAVKAAEALLEELEWEKDSIAVLIYATQSPELSRPSTSFLIQAKLGIGVNCLTYDINMGCAGYIGGMETILSILSVTKGRGILLVGESHAAEGGAINTSTLLVGDAASATALEYDEHARPIRFRHFSDGKRADLIYKPFNKPGYMDGNAVLLFGLNDVVNSVKDYHEQNNIVPEDIDYYIFHQAQKMIVEGISEGAHLPPNKVLLSCGDYGNTSSASIPITINVSIREKSNRALHLLLCGFGIGLSWGIMDMIIMSDVILPLIETDEIFIDRDWIE